MSTPPSQPPSQPAPAAPAARSAATRPTPTRSSSRRPFTDLLAVGFLSAALATGGTYAAVRIGEGAGDGAQVVEQAPAGDSAAQTAGTGQPESAAQTADHQGTTADPAGGQDWASVAAAVSPSVVSIAVAGPGSAGAGSGVVWDTDGHVVTNAHVVEGGQQVQVSLADGRTYPAEVVGADPSSDLAVLQLDEAPADLDPVTVGDDDQLQVGDPVMAVGNPLGLSGTVTTGIVSALDRPVTTQGSGGSRPGGGVPVVTNAIQTSAAINPGNSGGALVNTAGELVGINSSIASLSQGPGGQGGNIGIGFAIPAVKVQLIVDQLLETGEVSHAFLGVGLSDGQARADGAILSGAQVQQIEPGSPAAEADLRTGDIVIGMDGEPVSGATALVGKVRERRADETATLTLVRDGQEQEVEVTLATRPDER